MKGEGREDGGVGRASDLRASGEPGQVMEFWKERCPFGGPASGGSGPGLAFPLCKAVDWEQLGASALV